MNKKVLALVIGSALTVPSAFAAEDTSGMMYTSASEGFYASIRAAFESGASKNAGGNIQNSSSRFGVRGTNDLGGGLEGFYQYEAGVDIDNGGGLNTRVGLVGLRGNFGELAVGSFWVNSYNWTYGSTDIANSNSGSLVYSDTRVGRGTKSIQYTTPDLNGFQSAVLIRSSNEGTEGTDSKKDQNAIDSWNLAAQYNIQGFSVGGSYNNIADGIAFAGTVTVGDDDDDDLPGADGLTVTHTGVKKDLTSWTGKIGYAQDNWYVNSWYGEDSTGDSGTFVVGGNSFKLKDTEYVSIGGGVSIDKVNLYGLYEQTEYSYATASGSKSVEETLGTIGVQYNLGARSRVWVEYAARDNDVDSSVEDSVHIGLRHDF